MYACHFFSRLCVKDKSLDIIKCFGAFSTSAMNLMKITVSLFSDESIKFDKIFESNIVNITIIQQN